MSRRAGTNDYIQSLAIPRRTEIARLARLAIYSLWGLAYLAVNHWGLQLNRQLYTLVTTKKSLLPYESLTKTMRNIIMVHDQDDSFCRAITNPGVTSLSPSPLEFVHIPRTGGKTIEALGSRYNISWGCCHWMNYSRLDLRCPRRKHSKPNHPHWNTSYWHVPIRYHSTGLSASDPTEETWKWYESKSLFAVVRDPFHRAVSQWNFACKLPSMNVEADQCGNATLMNQKLLEIARLTEKAGPGTVSRATKPSKEYFLADGRFIPQVDYVTNIPPNKLGAARHNPEQVYIIRQESFLGDLSCLLQRFGLKWRLPASKRDKEAGRLTVSNLTRKTRDVLAHVYAEDFDVFGYAKQIDNRSPV
jgi:hypothetical protein